MSSSITLYSVLEMSCSFEHLVVLDEGMPIICGISVFDDRQKPSVMEGMMSDEQENRTWIFQKHSNHSNPLIA